MATHGPNPVERARTSAATSLLLLYAVIIEQFVLMVPETDI